MISFLNKPYPCHYGQKDFIIVSFLVGTFISIFLGVFQPFGIVNYELSVTVPLVIGFGLVTFSVCIFMQLFIPHFFSNFYTEQNFTIGKEILVTLILVLLIGIGNYFYMAIFWSHLDTTFSPKIIGQTFIIAVFPVTFLTMLQFNRLQKANLKASKELQAQKSKFVDKPLKTKQFFKVVTSGEVKSIEIPQDHLLYIESKGNYAHVAQLDEGSIQKQMYRTTLKALADSNASKAIIRCHRSFIVNLEKVEEISGNAQGLKLSIKGTEDLVPVSRKYINEVRNYFNGQ